MLLVIYVRDYEHRPTRALGCPLSSRLITVSLNSHFAKEGGGGSDGSKTVNTKTKTVNHQTVRSARTCMTNGRSSALSTVYFLLIHCQIHFDMKVKSYTFKITLTLFCYQSS